MRRVEALALQIPEVDKTIGVSGVNLLVGAPQSNAGLLVVRLKDWSARTSPETSLRSSIGSFYAQAQGITEAQVLPFNPPAIPGLSATGGFSMMIQDKSGKGARALRVDLRRPLVLGHRLLAPPAALGSGHYNQRAGETRRAPHGRRA